MTIETFGARLRLARERRQLTLADIAELTKINASLFEAIERDDASRWPSGIFRRSFIRAYANAVGLDAEATVREFVERFPDPAEPSRPSPAGVSVPPAAEALQLGDRSPAPARVSPAAAPVSAVTAAPHAFRLTLVETGLPFTGGRFLADARRRWSAAAWDVGSLFAIAVSVFVFMDAFWMPFAVTALCYYVGGVLLLGNSPGVCLFAPRHDDSGDNGSKPARARRTRPTDAAPVRPAEAAFGFRAERPREVRG
ncbi:MAG TPA: helix-turn-helix transcriptional regulator [Vicinamibacterales bacterium]|nr:helix-turn-helix transcriptional regulator [Vicinamibacterales bacterium]